MKVNIHKHQSGGPFVTIRPVFDSPEPVENVPFFNKQSESIVDTESDELLKKGGLTSDYYSFLDDLSKIQENPLSFLNTGSTQASRLIKGKVNEMINNKEMWKDSFALSKELGTLNEVAVGSSGELFYKTDDDDIGIISATNYKPDSNIKLLTVGELLMERQTNKNLAFDQKIFNIADNSVGMKSIIEHITGLFDTLSQYNTKTERTYDKQDLSKEYKTSSEIIAKAGRKPTEEETRGLLLLQEKINTPGKYIKETIDESGKGKDLRAALGYIWGTLTRQAQTKLSVQSKLNGTNPLDLIGSMLQNYGARSVESIISPEKESSITDKQTSTTDDKSLTTFQLFHNDKMFSPNMKFGINDEKLGVLFQGVIGGVSPIITIDGKYVQNATIGDIIKSAGYGTFLESNKVFFGNKKVDVNNLDNVIYDEGDAAKVYMPVGKDGSPDWEAFKDFKDIYAVYESNKNNWTAKDAENYFRDNGYLIKIEERLENGKFEKFIKENSQIKPFLVMYGYTNDATNLTDDNPWITKLTSAEEDAILPKLKGIWTVGSGKNAVDITPNKRFNKEDYYKGIVTIPYREGSHAIVSSLVNQGPREVVPTYGEVQRNLLNSSQSPMRGSSGYYLNNN